MRYPHLASRIFNTPLLVHPQKLDAIIAGLGPRLLGAALLPNDVGQTQLRDPEAIAPEFFSTRRGERSEAGYMVTEGVAVLRVMGALAHRSKLDADSSYILGYNEVAGKLEHAMDSPDVHAVVAMVDSPGGEAQGAFELAQRTFDYRGKKPLVAVADGMAASAAYLFASAADELVVTSTGWAGSIGVVRAHVDFSRMLANEGIAVTHIFAGAHKIDGNQFEALPPAVRADFQSEINALYDMFVGAVARHLNVKPEAVRATEARMYMGEAAITAGLVRRVATADQILTELAGRRARSFSAGAARSFTADKKGSSMSGNQPAADGTTSANQPAAGPTAADVERARAEGRTEGATQERTRIKSIMGLSMPGHEALVQKLAFESDTSAGDAALAVIAAERELRDKRGKDHLNDAPAALQMRPGATVRNESGQGMSRGELAQKAQAYVAANPGTTFVQAVKILEQQGA